MRILLLLMVFTLTGCPTPAPVPLRPSFSMPFFYKTSSGADLLNTQTPGSYKQTDLLVTSKVIPEGGSSSQVINLAVPEITIINDAASGYNYFVAELPTEVHRHIVESYVRLTPNLTDTLTYEFRSPDVVSKIYYNKGLVWDIANLKQNQWMPIIVVR
ncbi:MAG: hypothetical protein U0289_13620 [Cyclobacteriaceae bacterium]|nr:hypothetical protein [Cyclobacteriaceae bacterium]HQQ84241.1 hypothetical protein [Cyclobacteriaceae bacterium]